MRHIAFNENMFEAITSGRKTQTRRVMKAQPEFVFDRPEINGLQEVTMPNGKQYWNGCQQSHPSHISNICPYGKAGDILNVTAQAFLVIKNVRIERLQDISDKDAIAEGIEEYCTTYLDYSSTNIAERYFFAKPKPSFRTLWQSIYDKESPKSWHKNPWVWVIEFEIPKCPNCNVYIVSDNQKDTPFLFQCLNCNTPFAPTKG